MFCFGFYSYHNKFYNTYQTSFRVSAFFYITIIKPTRSLSTVIRSSQLREASNFNPLTNCNGSETDTFGVGNCIASSDESTNSSYEVKVRCNSLSESRIFAIMTKKTASPTIVRDQGKILSHGRALQNEQKTNIILIYFIAQH